ncbi:PLP-dependent cysteine synthase family protein [Halolamina sp. CBA1230]|uniref:PLP-dependent cysteine synthase family protein n=1 Tax=Halolamina sp. CBA1230 TaxID=1853690 RepID=UPI0009A22790|nr:PLP-dependent cysteine synthase family protein [Halolamina sp. CBA1230]QKY19400.1 PLP-dependent cysteine synthase family protein [Halolamina sp. CBA1230]
MDANVIDAIGSPLVEVASPVGTVAAKLESKNPGGSAKDRPALYMIRAAEESGELGEGDAIVEPTSGNTGIGLAMIGAVKGYDVRIVIPESKSPERRRIMRAYGADIEMVDGDIGDARDRADELEATGEYVQVRQFENAANPRAHYETTGPEILDQVDREVDAFVAGVGTGGTLTGTSRRLREAFPAMEVVAVEPAGNAVLSGGESGADEYQGMGPGFVSPNLDVELIDAVETVGLETAERECRCLASEEGILVGQSSGAANVAARRTAKQLAEAGVDDPLVVTVFPDGGERYMSTGLFEAEDAEDCQWQCED